MKAPSGVCFSGSGLPHSVGSSLLSYIYQAYPGDECVDCGLVERLDSSGLGFNPRNIYVSYRPKC